MAESPVFVVRTNGVVLAHLAEGGSLRLGRNPVGNDVVLEDPSVSRFHARLRWPRGHAACVDDLGSANGTSVEGTRIRGSAKLEELCHLRLGNAEVVIELQHPALIPDPGHLVCRLYTDLDRPEGAGLLTPARGLVDLLFDLERSRRTGTLLLVQGRAAGQMVLAGGRIAEAIFGRQRGAPALRSMLDQFDRAAFRLAPDVEPCEGSPWISLREVLAERSDETDRMPRQPAHLSGKPLVGARLR